MERNIKKVSVFREMVLYILNAIKPKRRTTYEAISYYKCWKLFAQELPKN